MSSLMFRLRLAVLVSLVLAVPALARPVTWTLKNVAPASGRIMLTGSFVYDTATITSSAVNITDSTTQISYAVWNNDYDWAPGANIYSGAITFIAKQSNTQNAPVVMVRFKPFYANGMTLSDSGGTLQVAKFFYGTCTDSSCSKFQLANSQSSEAGSGQFVGDNGCRNGMYVGTICVDTSKAKGTAGTKYSAEVCAPCRTSYAIRMVPTSNGVQIFLKFGKDIDHTLGAVELLFPDRGDQYYAPLRIVSGDGLKAGSSYMTMMRNRAICSSWHQSKPRPVQVSVRLSGTNREGPYQLLGNYPFPC